ncbi:hypothetical protein J3R83DRAFT_9415, partial [Lanmaoa asiatica]
MECKILNFSLFSKANNNPSRGDISYHVLAFEPGGKAMMSLVGYEPSSLHWTIRHPAGATVNHPLSQHRAQKWILQSPGVLEATRLKITSSVSGCLMPCGSWEMSFSGGKPPYLVNIVALKSGSVYNYSVPSGEHILSYTSRGELSGQVT